MPVDISKERAAVNLYKEFPESSVDISKERAAVNLYKEFPKQSSVDISGEEATWGESVSSIGGQLAGTIKEMAGGFIRSVGEMTFNPVDLALGKIGVEGLEKENRISDPVAEFGRELYRQGVEQTKASTPQNQTLGQKAVSTAVISLGTMIPGAIIAVATKQPNFLLASMGLVTFGQSYGEGREGGLDSESARTYGSIQGGIEMATEMLPVRFLFKAGSSPFKRLVSTIAADVPGENIATVTQSVNSWLYGLKEDLTVSELVEEMKVATLASMIGAPVQSGIASGVHAVLPQQEEQEERDSKEKVDPVNDRDSRREKAYKKYSKMEDKNKERDSGTIFNFKGEQAWIKNLDNWFRTNDLQKFQNENEARKYKQIIKENVGNEIGPKPSVFRPLKRGKYDEATKKLDAAVQIYIDLKSYEANTGKDSQEMVNQNWAMLTREQQDLIFQAQQEVANNPELVEMADHILESSRLIGEEAKNEHVIKNMRDLHLSRFWNLDKGKGGKSRVKKASDSFKQQTGLSKERKYESIIQGWADGSKLKIEGASNSILAEKNMLMEVIENKKLIATSRNIKIHNEETGKNEHLLSTKRLNGYVRVEPPNFYMWEYAGTMDVTSVIKHVGEMTEQIRKEESTGKDSRSMAKLKERVSESLIEKGGFTEGEAENFIIRLEENGKKNLSEKDKAAGEKEIITRIIEDIKTKLRVLLREQNITDREIIRDKIDKVKFKPYYSDDMVIEENGAIFKRKVLYAPKEVGDNLNKILSPSRLKDLGGTTGASIDAATKYNAVLKAYILQTSLFHHLAFTRSYLLGTSGKKLHEWNPVRAYKDGLESIKNQEEDLVILVENGLTLGRMQDWEESLLREEDTIFGEAMKKMKLGKVADKVASFREAQADFLFKELGAGLKAKAALIEHRYALKKYPQMNAQKRAMMVAELINEDFGGLHHKRIGRSATTQHFLRLGFLAPDWTESNVRTFARMMDTSKHIKNDPIRQETVRRFYRKFWAGVLTKGLTAHIVTNMLLSLADDKDALERFKIAWKAGNYRWLDVDITPIYRMMNKDSDKGERKYWSIFGHFKDPIRWLTTPVKILKHKGSVLGRMGSEAWEGADWRGRPFTTFPELIGVDRQGEVYEKATDKHEIGDPKGGQLAGQFVKYGRSTGELSPSQLPSFILSQIKGIQPIQAQQLIAFSIGEIDGFAAVAKSLGLRVSRYKEPTSLKKFNELFKEIKQLKARSDSRGRMTLTRGERIKLKKYERMKRVKKILNKISRSIHSINKSTKLTEEQKAEKVELREKRKESIILRHIGE